MGSSPIVSTKNPQVTGSLCGRSGRRAHYVPTNSGVRCVIVGTGGHGRLLAESLGIAPTIPSPVASSVMKIRSQGMSPVGVTPQCVIPQPLLVSRVEQLNEIKDRAAWTLEDM